MKDLYQDMTDMILGSVDDAGQWTPCWSGLHAGLPKNAVTNKTYRGVNILSCWLASMRKGFACNRWATFKQWQDAGAQVRKGERGTPIIFYRVVEGADESKDRVVLKGSHVFNAEQVDGAPDVDAMPIEPLDEGLRIAKIEAWLAMRRWTMTVEHKGDQRAYYQPSTDSINMPDYARFVDAEHYYSTLFHEATHWTGAKHRLDRDLANYKGEARAREELVAELGAAFLCAEHGIGHITRDDHVSYIASWLQALKNDKRAIVQAASLASAAIDYLDTLDVPERMAA